MMRTVCVPFLAVFLIAGAACQEPPRVDLDNLGTLIGKVTKTRNNRTLHTFQGIPFAEPPSGKNRFQPPITKQWSGDLDATNPGFACIQPDYAKIVRKRRDLAWDTKLQTNFSLADPEDCLTLNVYTPDLTHAQSLPVVVFYHGGSFVIGDESRFRPDYLLDRDVVLVVPQYRLGPFGFLSMQNEKIPGNVGLLDCLEALKWVQGHISKFGGNKEKVTVFGQSAGASIANFLMLSPLTKGLMHGVIMNSGSALASFALDKDPIPDSKRIATLCGCVLGDDDRISQCLQDVPAEKLLGAFTTYSNLGGTGGTLPVISRPDEPEATKFLPDDPVVLAEKGKYQALPMLAGAVKHDSMFVVNIIHKNLSRLNLTNSDNFVRNKLTRYMIEFAGIEDRTGMIEDVIENRYFSYVDQKQRGNFTAMVPGMLDFTTTIMMKAPGLKMVQLNSENANSYWYTFNYHGRLHIPENGINDPGGLFTEGACHSDDMIYLTPRLEDKFSVEELTLSNMMIDLWANFIISGNPNEPRRILTIPDWPKYDVKDKSYYELNKSFKVMKDYTKEFTAAIQDVTPKGSAGFQTPVMANVILVAIAYFMK
ncbi:liver carboxylesterase 1F-like [Neocloeon triangulifer]|uniref:liver carboxylesterase 1F-like n=1 Tax=Neocloeon triangulifer TaxID=2078957 RepID=UPI00286F5E8E|nr:liver carboxylesterase 1F-like [Neocloeon triangulifer]